LKGGKIDKLVSGLSPNEHQMNTNSQMEKDQMTSSEYSLIDENDSEEFEMTVKDEESLYQLISSRRNEIKIHDFHHFIVIFDLNIYQQNRFNQSLT
jgi:hypothetical protein